MWQSSRRTSAWVWLTVAASAVMTDQLTKFAIIRTFAYGEQVEITPFFNLVHVLNPGAAFSFLADQGGWQKFFFLGLAVVISLYLARAIWRDEFGRWGKLGAAMIIGGAIGNVVDRLIHGHVVDFLLFYWQNWFYPAFNIADSFICVGAVCLVLDGLLHKKTPSNDTKAV
ncbi:MAG: signal peptidase II [Neisseria sp.]|nr:signal peptidase II [Neisseria sp.]